MAVLSAGSVNTGICTSSSSIFPRSFSSSFEYCIPTLREGQCFQDQCFVPPTWYWEQLEVRGYIGGGPDNDPPLNDPPFLGGGIANFLLWVLGIWDKGEREREVLQPY